MAVQTSLNGHVSELTGSALISTAVNQSSGLFLALVVAALGGTLPRGLRHLRRRRDELRIWWFAGGAIGVAAVFVGVLAAPAVGVVMVAVGLTLGQLLGSVMTDMLGLGPRGRALPTPLRLAGVGCAAVGALVGAWGRVDDDEPWILTLVVLAGIAIALQQAANGRLVVMTGHPSAMSVINFGGGTALVLAVLAVAAVDPVDAAALPPWSPLGGLLGAVVGATAAICSRHIGMLAVMLAITAGQAVAALLLDALAPIGAIRLGPGSYLGAALTILAVGLAGWAGLRPRHRRPKC